MGGSAEVLPDAVTCANENPKIIQNFRAAPVFKKGRAISLTPAESRSNSHKQNGGASCGVNDVQNGAGEAFRSPSGQSAPKKGVPGDGDALLFWRKLQGFGAPRNSFNRCSLNFPSRV